MASYPTAVKTFVSRNAGDVIQPAHINDLQDEVNAIEAGILNGTAPFKSSNSTVNHFSVLAGMNVVGNSTLASTITIGTLPYIFPSVGGSTGQVLAISSTSGSTMTLVWQAAVVGQVTLLRAANGTDANAAATTVDSIALTGLTANDRIRVEFLVESSSQNTAQCDLRHVTDNVALTAITPSPLAAGNAGAVVADVLLSQRQGNSTTYAALVQGMVGSGTRNDFFNFASVTTAWTGSWTLGLHHGGVVNGGSFKYAWSVYKLAGQ